MVYPGNVYDADAAKAMGIDRDFQVVVMFHCGSRGFGHQVGTDYLDLFGPAMKRYGITIRDRELACAPFSSPEGQDYFKAMVCAANSAFANRQMVTHRIREVFSDVFKQDARDLGLEMVYDVTHNIAKIERYQVNGEEKELLIHRKGATRSFPPGHPELAERYRATGQPVIIGGSMETGSYLLIGTAKAMEESFGSTCHGSGRTMSRTAAKKKVHGRDLLQRMEQKGIYVRAASFSGVAEEAGMAYKNISDVVEAVDSLGLSKKVRVAHPPEGSNPFLPPGAPRAGGAVPCHGPAGHHRGIHGDRLVPPHRDSEGHGRKLWVYLPRLGPDHVPHGREEEGAWTRPAAADGTEGDLRQGRLLFRGR